ncbi:GntR family transcriptional regulator [Friedmanniella luteola]|uniref:GntR family transcriptional regulator n=1 Tax=Friedmanniella luteola TaxID=546871 RepID=A0A1H1NR19_9ACTN|nr:GntR family transcriptional regulator [Friedmanniella luteola]SDS01230.1 GntR family transcriptional regulator [Friedmanniella luteola]
MSTPAPSDLPALRLDPASALPVAEQIQVQVVDLVTSGVLPPGRRLPPVRTLAATLGVAPGTVAKAYRGLEQEGFVETAGRNGTVVADQRVEATARTRQQLRAVLQPLLDEGMSSAEVLRLVRSVLGG